MKIKNFLILVFCFVFLFSCTTRYDNHFNSNRNDETKEKIGYWDFDSNWKILIFPDKNQEDFLISAINSAQNRIWIEIYTWTNLSKINSAIESAKKRWVDIRVILEWNVYGSPYINVETKKFLDKNSIPNKYADNNKFNFTHAKFWLIDDDYYISTGNWTRSFFNKNREFIYKWNDEITKNFLEKIFLADFEYQNFVQKSEIPEHIVISPLNSREKIENFITNSESEIIIYVQTVSDEKILKILSDLQNSSKKIFLCTADNEWNREAFAKNPHLDWKFGKNPYLHAKMMISDDKKIFIWSQNFTKNSIENNREIGIILENKNENAQKLKKIIKNHCN